MAIEGNQEQVIPEFNAEAFLEVENEVGIGSFIQGVPLEEQQNKQTEEEIAAAQNKQTEEEISFDDDFITLESKKETPAEFNADDYAVLGKTLGVEIKTKEDLENVQAKFKPEVNTENTEVNSSNYNFSTKEQASFTNLSNALNSAEKATPEELMRWHLKQNNTSADYENNPEELDYHIETLKDTGMFDSQEKQVRSNLIKEISEQKEGLINTATNRDNESQLAVNQELQTAIKSYKDGFHGIAVTPKDLHEAFNSVRDGSVFKEIESNQANVAEMSLLWKHKELFYKAFENPGTSAGVKKMMDELQNAQAKPAAGNQTLKSPYVFDAAAFLASDEVKSV